MPVIHHDIPKLINGINSELNKRAVIWTTSDSQPARYAFFAIFAAAFVFFIVLICCVNNKRRKQGRAPMISSYLAPPNYSQSQNQYGNQTPNELPTYTPNANTQQDVGYYDKNGNFISANTVPINQNSNQPTSQSPHIPTAFQPSNTQSYNTVNVSQMSYSSPEGPPPNRAYTSTYMGGSSSTAENNQPASPNLNVGSSSTSNIPSDAQLPPYQPPVGGAPTIPEKSHYRNE